MLNIQHSIAVFAMPIAQPAFSTLIHGEKWRELDSINDVIGCGIHFSSSATGKSFVLLESLDTCVSHVASETR
jgi:hypothetical protein